MPQGYHVNAKHCLDVTRDVTCLVAAQQRPGAIEKKQAHHARCDHQCKALALGTPLEPIVGGIVPAPYIKPPNPPEIALGVASARAWALYFDLRLTFVAPRHDA
jgi:hypothetical protein